MELKKVSSATLLKERKKKGAQREKAYSGKWPKYDPLTIYKQIFRAVKTPENWPSEPPAIIPASVLKETQSKLKKGYLREEDLPPLLYIHYLLNGNDGSPLFDHIVIDEAQDFSPFQIAVLDLFVKGHSFTILGDLSQGIHAYKGVHAWEEMQSLFAPEHTAYHSLTRSYRSTMEIIDFANGILSSGVGSTLLAVPVFRSGNPVRLIPYSGGEGAEPQDRSQGRVKDLTSSLKSLSSREYRTVAILTRSLHDAKELHDSLSEHFDEINLIDGSMTEYKGGLSVLPLYLSKGLEFDAVIVADADLDHYGDTAWDAKLMYVGCTRALHELWLLHGGQQPSYLQAAATAVEIADGWPDGEVG
jgi:DNA helicase II / ATP-dependent DNA helicase PcrA